MTCLLRLVDAPRFRRRSRIASDVSRRNRRFRVIGPAILPIIPRPRRRAVAVAAVIVAIRSAGSSPVVGRPVVVVIADGVVAIGAWNGLLLLWISDRGRNLRPAPAGRLLLQGGFGLGWGRGIGCLSRCGLPG